MSRFSPPYLGSAYYPEAWPPEQVDEDVRLMLDAGLNVARIAEFAWSSIEPEEGRFELDWLRRVVDKLGDAGIATILCTPSCTPPAWLTQKYPEVILVEHSGRPVQHGSRRHVCPNNPVYRSLIARANAKLGEAFGRDDQVIGWQIDNEVYIWNEWGCYCDLCIQRFRDKMKEKFGTVEALNAAWGTDVWSQTYQCFSQLPAPRPELGHHPALLTAWTSFQNESIVDFVAQQADQLHELVSQPVSTDMMPFLGVSYEQIHRNLDIVQYNHYDLMDNLWRQVFWMDYVRTFKDKPWWNTETSTCWNGGTKANGYKEPGFCRVNSWLPIAMGGEANLYWLWRSHWSGQELMHGSVISSCGRPLHIIDEVREVSAGYRTAAEFLNNTRLTPSGVAVHLSTLAWTQLRFQPMVNGFDYLDHMIHQVYRPIMDAHLRADVIDPAMPIDTYSLLFSPFLPALDESGLRERLLRWIEAGGTWVAGPLSDTRDLHAAKFSHAPFGSLEDWTGVYCPYEVPGEPQAFAIDWADGRTGPGSLWYAAFEPNGSSVLASYADGPFRGMAAVTETAIGKGRLVLLGTLPPPDALQRLLLDKAAEQGIGPVSQATANVLVVPRSGSAGTGAVVVELEHQPGTFTLDAPARDLLTGKTCSGTVPVAPYEVLVLCR